MISLKWKFVGSIKPSAQQSRRTQYAVQSLGHPRARKYTRSGSVLHHDLQGHWAASLQTRGPAGHVSFTLLKLSLATAFISPKIEPLAARS